jgi:hypothetical protein
MTGVDQKISERRTLDVAHGVVVVGRRVPAEVISRLFPWVRKGSTRAVLVLGPLALKFARGERGRRCNRFEAEMYKRVSARRRAMLCPVLWCTPAGNVLLMRTARPLTESKRDHLMENDGFPDWDYVPPDEGSPFEYKASDWGWPSAAGAVLGVASCCTKPPACEWRPWLAKSKATV